MNWRQALIAVSLAVAVSRPAAAWDLFGKNNKPKPAERVPQLIGLLKTETDDRKREAAVKELRGFDGTAFPDIAGALIEAVLSDPKPSVRSEAVDSLAHLRPVTQSAGLALEQAQDKDASLRVRLQARRSLLTYRLAGYRSKGTTEEIAAAPNVPAQRKTSILMPWKSTGIPGETAPPPLASPDTEPKLTPAAKAGTSLAPVAPPVLLPPPVRTTDGQ